MPKHNYQSIPVFTITKTHHERDSLLEVVGRAAFHEDFLGWNDEPPGRGYSADLDQWTLRIFFHAPSQRAAPPDDLVEFADGGTIYAGILFLPRTIRIPEIEPIQ